MRRMIRFVAAVSFWGAGIDLSAEVPKKWPPV